MVKISGFVNVLDSSHLRYSRMFTLKLILVSSVSTKWMYAVSLLADQMLEILPVLPSKSKNKNKKEENHANFFTASIFVIVVVFVRNGYIFRRPTINPADTLIMALEASLLVLVPHQSALA